MVRSYRIHFRAKLGLCRPAIAHKKPQILLYIVHIRKRIMAAHQSHFISVCTRLYIYIYKYIYIPSPLNDEKFSLTLHPIEFTIKNTWFLLSYVRIDTTRHQIILINSEHKKIHNNIIHLLDQSVRKVG